jgi:hypothetical protein
LFEDTNLCAIHAKRVTIMPKDMQLARWVFRALFEGSLYSLILHWWVLMIYYRYSLFAVASVESVLPVSSVNFKRLVFVIFFGDCKGNDEWRHSFTTIYDL